MRRFRWQIWSLLLLLLLLVPAGRIAPVATGQITNQEGMLRLLASRGIPIKQSFSTNAYAMFDQQPGASLGVETDAGFIEIIFLPESVEGRLEVKPSGEYQYGWEVHNWRPEPQSIGSNHTIYFTIHRNLFIMAHTEQAHAQVQRVFN